MIDESRWNAIGMESIFEMKTGITIFKGNDGLKVHLDSPSKLSPELHGNPEDFKSTLPLRDKLQRQIVVCFWQQVLAHDGECIHVQNSFAGLCKQNSIKHAARTAKDNYHGIKSNFSALNLGKFTDDLHSIINLEKSLSPKIFSTTTRSSELSLWTFTLVEIYLISSFGCILTVRIMQL